MNKKIKSITLFKYDFINQKRSGEESDEKGNKFSYTELDEKGNLLVEIKYNPQGEVEEKYLYTFDNQGNLTEEISYLSDDEIAEHKTYEYEPEGKLMKAFKHYADGSKDIILYDYDIHGNLSSKTTTDSENEIEAKEILEWENKSLVKKEVYEFDELVSKETNAFDEKGNRIENSKWTPDEGTTRSEYFYNDKGDLFKQLIYNKDDKLVAKTIYSYNEHGKVVEMNDESIRSKSNTTILYDEKGNATDQTEVNENGEVNNRAIRKYNDRNEVVETSVIIDLHGKGLNQEYLLHYEYEYFEN